MLLPEPTFKFSLTETEELFSAPNREISGVLNQGNPVYFKLDLPGILLPVHICFPAPRVTRVYSGDICKTNLVGEKTDQFASEGVPDKVHYRYGMRIVPWMFLCWIDLEMMGHRSRMNNIINYVLINGTYGHDGVLVRVDRRHLPADRNEESMEVYSFSMGNDSCFVSRWRGDPNTKMLARFVPQGANTNKLIWLPQQPVPVAA